MIEDAQTWWGTLDDAWPDILVILDRFLGQRTPSGARVGGLSVLADANTIQGRSVLQVVEVARRDRDHETLLKYLNAAWWAAPDAPWIHEVPGWSDLCELCSEDWAVWTSEETDGG